MRSGKDTGLSDISVRLVAAYWEGGIQVMDELCQSCGCICNAIMMDLMCCGWMRS